MLSFLEARALAEERAAEDEKIIRFWRDGSMWRVEYERSRLLRPEDVPPPEELPDTAQPGAHARLVAAAEAGKLAAVIGHREEIVGPVKTP